MCCQVTGPSIDEQITQPALGQFVVGVSGDSSPRAHSCPLRGRKVGPVGTVLPFQSDEQLPPTQRVTSSVHRDNSQAACKWQND